MVGWNLSYLSRLTNDPITYDMAWLAMATKIPSDILKFEEKATEGPVNHVMSFHLQCSYNRIIEESVWLCLFQRTLTGLVAKFYVDALSKTYTIFEGLSNVFPSFFQLPITHDTCLEILIGIHQTKTTHIYDHIHECRWHHPIFKIDVGPKFLLNWFLKSLLSSISKDVTMDMPRCKMNPSSSLRPLSWYMHNPYIYIPCYHIPHDWIHQQNHSWHLSCCRWTHWTHAPPT